MLGSQEKDVQHTWGSAETVFVSWVGAALRISILRPLLGLSHPSPKPSRYSPLLGARPVKRPKRLAETSQAAFLEMGQIIFPEGRVG